MTPTTSKQLYRAAYDRAIAEGRTEAQAVEAGFAAADAWTRPEPPEPEPAHTPEPGEDPLLRAAALADARDELNARRARGARVLLAEAGGGTAEDLAELSDTEILAAVDRQTKKRAAAEEANSLSANKAAAAEQDPPAWRDRGAAE